MENVEWIFKIDKKNNKYILAKCGMWEAELAMEVYAKGQVRISPNVKNKSKITCYWGQKGKEVVQPTNLIKLIQDVSERMVDRLHCKLVYLASLNESGLNNKKNLIHFWLIPRYKEHKELLGIDGFVLISELRNNWVEREKTGEWVKWNMPPKPTKSKKGRDDLNKMWEKYAKEYIQKFK